MTFTTRFLATALTAALFTVPALAQIGDHSGHDMSQMDHGSMDHDAMMKARAEHMIEATGVVKQIYKKDGLVSLSHNAIPAISWPPMTMKFPVGDNADLDSLSIGQTVQFTLHRAPDGRLPLVELCPTQSANVIEGLCAPGMNHGPDSEQPNSNDMDHSQMKHGDMSHHGMQH